MDSEYIATVRARTVNLTANHSSDKIRQHGQGIHSFVHDFLLCELRRYHTAHQAV